MDRIHQSRLGRLRFPFDGFVVVEKTRPGFVTFLWRRMRRLGIRKVADELLLRLYYVLFQGRRDGRMLREFMAEVQRDIPAGYRRPPVHRVYGINSEETAALLESLAPDVCILMLMPIVKKEILSIPPLGMLVFHPGLTPEYRGTHSAFWAVVNRELWGIGWSRLRIDTGIDTGGVLAQASTRNPDPLSESHVFLAHSRMWKVCPAWSQRCVDYRPASIPESRPKAAPATTTPIPVGPII